MTYKYIKRICALNKLNIPLDEEDLNIIKEINNVKEFIKNCVEFKNENFLVYYRQDYLWLQYDKDITLSFKDILCNHKYNKLIVKYVFEEITKLTSNYTFSYD